jgi:hypothetical protein
MSNNNLTVVKNKKETAQEEKRIVRDIKPKLERFLIDQQVNKASETAHKTHEENLKTIEEMEKSHADTQASKIAMHAFLDSKLWEKYPPPLEMAWITGKRSSDGRQLTQEELKSEIANDIAGFSTYLVREYMNMKDEIKKGTYRNPLSENEENTIWFWQKFCLDMTILMKSDIKYQKAGNKGLLMPNGEPN